MRKVGILTLAVLFVAGFASIAAAGGKKTVHMAPHRLIGEVVSVDAKAMTLTLKENVKGGETKEVPFTIDPNAKFMFHGKPGKIEDLKAGDSVTVKYMKKEGKDVAQEVLVAKTAPAKS